MKHGGDLSETSARYGEPAGGWLDLSTGINPNPFPLPELPPDCLTRLPDKVAIAGLEAAARAAYGVPDDAEVVAAPGTQALIQVAPRLLPPSPVTIPGPTYSEHNRAWRSAGHKVSEHPDASDAKVVVLVNPNNPDGARYSQPFLKGLAEGLSARSGVLVIDEAFADAHPEVSFVAETDRPAVLVLRSFGKFYGLAGLRLGFAIASPLTARRLRELLGPWAVSGPAIEIGRQALLDHDWATQTRVALRDSADRLDQMLASHGLEVVGGTSLFRLVRTEQAQSLHEGLARMGIWTRVFAHTPHWMRLGLPAGEPELRRLDAALSDLLSAARQAS